MDWNNDGKYDWKDDAIYNNVIAPENKSHSSSHNTGSGNKNSNNNAHYSSSGSSNGWAWFIIICVVYFLIKLIGG